MPTRRIETLVAVRDPMIRDQIRTALRRFPVFQTVAAPREKLTVLLKPPSTIDVVFVDLDVGSSAERDFVEEIRRINPTVRMAAVGPMHDRGLFSHAKLELDVATFVPIPLDAFDLMRRLKRLVEAAAVEP